MPCQVEFRSRLAGTGSAGSPQKGHDTGAAFFWFLFLAEQEKELAAGLPPADLLTSELGLVRRIRFLEGSLARVLRLEQRLQVGERMMRSRVLVSGPRPRRPTLLGQKTLMLILVTVGA